MSCDPTYVQEALAQGFVDRLQTALWIFDFDEQRVIWANQSALHAWQAETLDELRRRDLGADLSLSVSQRLKQYREDFITHDATFSELWTLYPKGNPLTMRVVFRGFRLEDDRMAMFCEGIESDVGAPEILRSADALLHTPVMISLFRQNGEPLYRNPAARIAYGGAPGAFAGQFMNPADHAAIEHELRDSRFAKRAASMKTIDGSRWHDMAVFCCKDAVTGEDSVLVSEIDISDMKAAQQRIGDFASISSDWLWEMDGDLRFSYFSERAKELSGTDIKAMLGKRRSDIVLQMDENWRAHFDDLNNRRPFRDFRYTKCDVDGKVFHISISGLPTFDQNGSFTGYRGTGTNITERVETEARIAEQHGLEVALAKEREINGLQRQFVSMVSHEFRTPLAVIDSSAQRVLRKMDRLPPERIADILQKVRRSVARLTELMESVLNAARLEEGRIGYEPTSCDLAGIIREICDSYGEVYPDHPIELRIDDLPDHTIADSKLIRQVVSNLASNAVKYSPEGTVIRVRGWQDEQSGLCTVSVQDEGVGIPKDELDKLCNRFFRASTSTGIAGTGIGLHLVQHFIALHGGTIEVESHEGIGSTFTFHLPIRAECQKRVSSADKAFA